MAKTLEKELGKKFGDSKDPLACLSSFRRRRIDAGHDGHRCLNLGLNDVSVAGTRGTRTGNERFAYDAYRRLINMYGDVVMGIDHQRV